MVLYFVVVCNGSDNQCSNMSLVVKRFESSPHASICIFGQLVFVVLIRRAGCFRIDPLFDFNRPCSIIKLVCVVCGLLRNVPDLSNKSYLSITVSM